MSRTELLREHKYCIFCLAAQHRLLRWTNDNQRAGGKGMANTKPPQPDVMAQQ
jgi:hypothetical protein